MNFAIDMAAATDQGRVRSHNEDSIAMEPRLRFAVLADGLGGYQAGEVASRIAVDVVSDTLKSALDASAVDRHAKPEAAELVARAISAANSAVLTAAQTHAEQAGMGTTLVVALWRGSSVFAGHVGDSRLYRMREARLRQLTRDHSLVQEQIDRGTLARAQAAHAAARAIVTRAVGLDADLESEVRAFDTAAADVYLLCSDGLSDMLSDDEIESVLAARLPELQHAADALIDAANDKGGRDNISVVLARVREGDPAA